MDGGLGFGEKALLIGGFAYGTFKYLPTTQALALTVAAVTCMLLYQRYLMNYFQRLNIPVPSGSNLFLGHIKDFRNKGAHHMDMEWTKNYGNIFGTYIFGSPTLVVADLDILKEVFVKNFATFPNRRSTAFDSMKTSIRRHFLTSVRDQRWKDVRSTITPAFTSGKMKQMLPLMHESVGTLSKVLGKKADEKGDLDVKDVMGKLTMEVIAKTAFAMDSHAQEDTQDPFIEHVKRMLSLTFSSPSIIFLMLFTKFGVFMSNLLNIKVIDPANENWFINSVEAIIRQRKEGGTQPGQYKDFLQLMLNSEEISGEDKAKDNDIIFTELMNSSKKVNLTHEEITAQSLLFLVAGYETTASTLQFILYFLALNPEIQDRLVKEIRDHIGDKSDISYEDLAKMELLEGVMMETLRMCPPAVRTEREAEEEVTIKGLRIPKGLIVSVPIYAIHHDPEHYPEPEKFRPERFMGEEKRERNPLTYLPFGYGPRNCIGMRFAQMEIRLTLAKILPLYKFTTTEKTEAYPFKVKPTGLFGPLEPLMLGVERRV